MTRQELITALAASRGLPTTAAREVVDTILGTVEEALIEGGRVEVRGFGSFSTRTAKAYSGHIPQSGERIAIPERRVAVFRPAKALADAVARTAEDPEEDR